MVFGSFGCCPSRVGKNWARISASANDEKLYGCSLIENQQGVRCKFLVDRLYLSVFLALAKSWLGYLLMMRNERVELPFI